MFLDVADTTEGLEKYTTTEGQETAQFVNESGNLPKTELKKGRIVTFIGQGYGSRATISKEVRVQAKDNLTKLQSHVTEEIDRSITNMMQVQEFEGHRFLNQAFTIAAINNPKTARAVSIISPDGEPLISATHSYVNGNTFDNLLPAAALTLATFEDVETRSGAFLDAENNPMPFEAKKLIVKNGGVAHQAAKRILGVRAIDAQYRVATTDDINYRSYDGYTIVATPYMTSSIGYFFVSDYSSIQNTLKNPMFLNHQQRPRLEGLQQESNNLDWTYSFFGHLKLGVRNLPVGIYGSAGA